jgi:hypothetical protein
MAGIHLELAVVGPEVDRRRDGRNTALVDHVCCLCASNGELLVGVFLPVAEEEGELCEEAVVHVAHELNGRGG